MDRRTWTDEDRALIAGMKRAGISNKAIAERMGATERSIAHVVATVKAYRRLDHSIDIDWGPSFRPDPLSFHHDHAIAGGHEH